MVTIIIPNYNREIYIEECIKSVYNQTYRPIELIVVDDGSTDDSLKIIKKCRNEFSLDLNFRFIILRQSNSGAPRARNFGYVISQGSYIQWLDSDDLLLPHKIESQVNVFAQDIHVVYSRAQFFKDDPSKLKDKYWGRPPTFNSSDYFEFPWQTMCALYKREAIELFGVWQENLTISQDWEFAMRYRIKAKVKYLDDISSLYRDHSGDRIGKAITVEKINSLSNILIKTFKLSKEKGLIDDYLRKRYQSRFMYCIVQYGALGCRKEQKILINSINSIKLSNNLIKILSILSNSFIYRIILKLHSDLRF